MPRSLNKFYLSIALLAFFSYGFKSLHDSSAAKASKNSVTHSLNTNPNRNIASFGIEGKGHTLILVSLRALEGDNNNDIVHLVGEIKANQSLELPLQYQWELPAGVEVMTGNAHGVLGMAQSGQSYEVQLSVRGFNQDEKKLIILHGFIGDEDNRIGHSAVITSRPQDSIDILAKADTAEKTLASDEQILPKAQSQLEGPIQR